MELMNLGGGFPVQMVGDEPTIEEIGKEVNQALKKVPDHIRIVAEPGRFFVASAGCLVLQVIGLAKRGETNWCYLDAGLYSGLMEIVEQLPYSFYTDRVGEVSNWTIAGPTCDSVDVLVRNYPLPQDMQIEDFVYIPYTGAYSQCTGSTFNGFPSPRVVVA